MARRTNLAHLFLAGLLAIWGPLPFACEISAGEAPSLRGVYNALGGTMTPAWVAQELGLFAKHGLQHSLSYLAATTAIQAIVGGTEEIGLVGNQGIDVALEGADTVTSPTPRLDLFSVCTANLLLRV
jgi:ABC-type nitrate/sulfonate/bicarbonate transport system substrate-binding protein